MNTASNPIVFQSGSSRIEQKPTTAPYCPNAASGRFELFTCYGYSGTFATLEAAMKELSRLA
jgi:hypothetical protein